MRENTLIRNILKLTWGINKFLPDLISKLDYGEEITNAEAKAHFDVGPLVAIY
jgi:hypothetical protein